MKTRSFESIKLKARFNYRQKRLQKKLGAQTLMNNLRALVLKRLMQQFSDLRNRITKKHRKELVLKTMVGNTLSWQKRQAFWIWKR